MRYVLVPLIALSCAAAFGIAGAQTQTPQQQQKSAPSSAPGQPRGVDDHLSSTPGKNGKQEPSAAANNDAKEKADNRVFVNGALNVPGAAADSQTVPAKFSARNDAIDKTPILAMPNGLTAEQKQKILATVRSAGMPVVNLDAKLTSELPSSVNLIDLPAALKVEIPNARDLKFVRLADRVLIVYAPHWTVVGEIKGE
jgi:hypothetical protein